MATMNSPNSSIRVRGGRTRHKIASHTRSGSGDDRKYIEHLEGELSAAQSEFPTATKEHTMKMIHITAENRQLQAELKDWEARYDEDVRDYVQQHTVMERALKSKNSDLEEYASKAKDRVAELEAQLQNVRQALEGAEVVNAQLEKRVEIMSELLTSSPAKLEFQSDAPSRRRMQSRPRSMLPCVPNARGSWIGSPERTPDFGAAASPATSNVHLRDSTSEIFGPLERIVSREMWSSSPNHPSEADKDERPLSARSTTFSDHFAMRDQEHQQTQSRARHRRMRRFGGSNGPKPLILPYASTIDSNPISAPPLERHETIPSLPFRRSVQLESSSPSRARASTSASETAMQFSDSPYSGEHDEAGFGFHRMLDLTRQRSGSRAYSSMSAGSDHAGLISRNLLDELQAAKIVEEDDRELPPTYPDDRPTYPDDEQATSGAADDLDDSPYIPLDLQALLSSSPIAQHDHGVSDWNAGSLELLTMQRATIIDSFGDLDPDNTPRALIRTKRASSVSSRVSDDMQSLSALDRLRHGVGDLLRSPADVARMIIHVTQQRMHIPAPLLTVQWWVVGLLWGPMAKRRMIAQSSTNGGRLPRRPDARTPTASLAVDESLAYGTIYTSPGSGLRRRAGMAGPGKKRSGNSRQCSKDRAGILSRHNPLLWVKFSLTLAYAVGLAFTSGPGQLMQSKPCSCPACKHAE